MASVFFCFRVAFAIACSALVRSFSALEVEDNIHKIFSLATKEQSANLQIGGHTLPQDRTPTYLGVMFDPRMTWKSQIEKCTTQAKLCMALMKKLSGTSWGTDYSIQKKLYVGHVRPVLEYGISWGTAAKSNFDKATRVQNQVSRIMTRDLRSTPIQAMDSRRLKADKTPRS